MPKYESDICPVRERVEHICRQTIRAMQRLKTTNPADTALQEVLAACNEALSYLDRSPHFPDGRLESYPSGLPRRDDIGLKAVSGLEEA